jgi:agmatinase
MKKQARSIGQMYGANPSDTFMGLPRCADLTRLDLPAALIGAPCATPYRSVGPYCAEAPGAIRAAMSHYGANLHHFDFDLGGPIFPGGKALAADCGDLSWSADDAPGNRARIKEAVRAILDKGSVPILLGGDDSVPIPMFEAFAGRGSYAIVQIDAHIDWRDEVNGERLGLSSPMRRASEMTHIKSMLQIGQRGLGSARVQDYEDARRAGVRFVSARELHAQGVGAALASLPREAQVIISFDCDALDPSIIAGVIGRAPGGLSYTQAIELLHAIAQRARIAAFALVEFMPERDIDGIGALTAGRLIVNALGAVARQH